MMIFVTCNRITDLRVNIILFFVSDKRKGPQFFLDRFERSRKNKVCYEKKLEVKKMLKRRKF